MIPIVPAIIPTTAEDLRASLPNFYFSPEIHIDVVDGKFVPFTSWPYQPSGQPLEVKGATDSFTLEVDLMVGEPLEAALDWIEAGADMLVFHVEAINLADFTTFVQQTDVSVSISALNDTPLETLLTYANVADAVQLMGIAKIGTQGQGFDNRVLERIKQVKEKFPHLPITVDGSVNEVTIKSLAEAGADRFICGSAIVKSANPKEVQAKLASLIS